MPQGLGLYRDLTVSENLAFVSNAYGHAVPDAARVARRQRRPPRDDALRSGGSVSSPSSSALAHDPDVLVLDEPTSGVDALARADLWDTIHEQAERGVGVLVTTHNMREAEQCDRLLLMSQARLVAAGQRARHRRLDHGGRRAHRRLGRGLRRCSTPPTSRSCSSGRDVRVADADADACSRSLLDDAGMAADVVAVPATIEERMMVLSREG